ncbi:hypothetical protein E4U55_003729 [Claviceps digitariae]|nr:hypothetical protein E4U55_003729 [Claviceps digitariae]
MTTTDESTPQDTTTGTFKDQLDKAATEQREREQPPKPNPIVEKSKSLFSCFDNILFAFVFTEFIPAASKILGTKEQPQKEEQPAVPGPPDRPVHDASIETFVRDQHRSKPPGENSNPAGQE